MPIEYRHIFAASLARSPVTGGLENGDDALLIAARASGGAAGNAASSRAPDTPPPRVSVPSSIIR
jgi:hypothetical protein